MTTRTQDDNQVDPAATVDDVTSTSPVTVPGDWLDRITSGGPVVDRPFDFDRDGWWTT